MLTHSVQNKNVHRMDLFAADENMLRVRHSFTLSVMLPRRFTKPRKRPAYNFESGAICSKQPNSQDAFSLVEY